MKRPYLKDTAMDKALSVTHLVLGVLAITIGIWSVVFDTWLFLGIGLTLFSIGQLAGDLHTRRQQRQIKELEEYNAHLEAQIRAQLTEQQKLELEIAERENSDSH